jgi:putative flippase GtrA
MRKFKIEATKFTIVGALNFVLTFLIFFSFLYFLNLHYLISLTSAWIIGNIFSYSINFVWVFKPEEKLHFKIRFVKYLIANSVSFSINILLLRFFVEISGFDPFYVQCTLIPLIIIINFGTSKFWSLKPRSRRFGAPK